MRNVCLAVALSCASVALASCGGGGGSSPSGGSGGGGGGSVPTPTPTPVGHPYALPSASPNVLSVFSINSNPTAMPVKIDNVSVGNTPQTASPAFANTPHTISITAPASAPPYVVVTAQTANGVHQVYYNSVVDTYNGKITSITQGSVARRSQSLQTPSVVRLAASVAGRALYSSTRLAVTYSAAAMGNRTVDTIERQHGVSSAITLSQDGGSITRAVTIAGTNIDSARRGLLAESGVTSVARIGLRYPLGTVYPNDSHFNDNEQWDMFRILMTTAWGYGLGASSISIAVIDTGYDPNQTEVAPNVTVSEKVLNGYIDSSAGAATDTNGHGTATSGVASAVTNNAAGFAGVGYGTKLQEYKIYGDSANLNPSADTADEAAAIREAVSHHANVILLPLGGSASAGPDPLERDAVAFAIANNVTVVAASGDERGTNGQGTTVDFPAALDGVISVGASAVNDANTPGDGIGSPLVVASYSNSGPGLTLVAPGGDASSASDTDQVHFIENAYTTQPFSGIPGCATPSPASSCYAKFTGTSFAAAHVAGAVGLVLAHDNLSPARMKTLIAGTADDIGDPLEGAGNLDVGRAMADATGNPPPQPKYLPAYNQFVAFAYSNLGANATVPTITDITYPHGVPVNSDGTFRIGDLPANTTTYRIAVWYDSNANGTIDAGDYFAVTGVCANHGQCGGANNLQVHAVVAPFTLP